jgi:hypothetical protein
MAVSFRAVGAYVNGTANLTPAIPAGTVAGDVMLCVIGTKPFNGVNTMPVGWVSLGFATNGTVNAGNDVGSMKAEIFYKIHTGTESNPTVVNATNNVSGAVIISFQKDPLKVWLLGQPLGLPNECVTYRITNTSEGAGSFSVEYTLCDGTPETTFYSIGTTVNVCSRTFPIVVNVDTTIETIGYCVGAGGGDDTANTTYSINTTTIIDYAPGDFLVGNIALRSDASTIGTITITGSGLTVSSFTKSPGTDLSTTAGGDMRMSVGRASITAGTSGTTLTMSSTLSGSQTGSSFIVRLRDVDAPFGTLYDPFGMMGFFGI